MIPLVTAIEDLDVVLPENAHIAWGEGSDSKLALTIESERTSIRFRVDSDTLIQRGEPYRKFVTCVARVLGVLAAEFPNRRDPHRRVAA
jgi:hypothetical protein